MGNSVVALTSFGKSKAILLGEYNSSLRLLNHITSCYNSGIDKGIIKGKAIDVVAYAPIQPLAEGQDIRCKILGSWEDIQIAYNNGEFDFFVIAMDRNINREALLGVVEKYAANSPVFWVDDTFISANTLSVSEVSEMFVSLRNSGDKPETSRMVMIGTDDICCRSVEKVFSVYNSYVKKWNTDKPLVGLIYYCELSENCRKYSHIYGVPTIPIYEIVERYRRGEIDVVVAPSGIYTYAFALLKREGIPENCMYVVDERVANANGSEQIIPISVLRPLSEIGYVHKGEYIEHKEKKENVDYKVLRCSVCNFEGEGPFYRVYDIHGKRHGESGYYWCAKCNTLQLITDNLDFYDEGTEYTEQNCREKIEKKDKELIIEEGSWDNVSELEAMQGENFETIRFANSFECFSNPLEALLLAKAALSEQGKIEVVTALFPNMAHEVFGPFWNKMDLVKCKVIHSRESVEYLAKAADLYVNDISWIKDESELPMSFLRMKKYECDDNNKEIGDILSARELEELGYINAESTDCHYGGRLKVILKKKCW